MNVALRQDPMTALCDVVRQSERAGAPRRVALLNGDKLPRTADRQHHVRLARQAMAGLAQADRAQSFELSGGRFAVVWRDGGRGEEVLAAARHELHLLLSDSDGLGGPASAELLVTYRLPEEAALLLDDLMERPEAQDRAVACRSLDLATLGRLEASLAQADLSQFIRSRVVAVLPTAEQRLSEPAHTPRTAWSEPHFDVDLLAAGLCPGCALQGEPWLFRRLTRTMDRRLLAILASPSGREDRGALAIRLNVATLLSPDFLRFEAAVRGSVTLFLGAADILSDPAAFAFGRNYVKARGHRLALADASPVLLRFFDAAAAGFEFVRLDLTPELRDGPCDARRLAGPGIDTVLAGLDRPSDLRWAIDRGFRLGCGRMVTP